MRKKISLLLLALLPLCFVSCGDDDQEEEQPEQQETFSIAGSIYEGVFQNTRLILDFKEDHFLDITLKWEECNNNDIIDEKKNIEYNISERDLGGWYFDWGDCRLIYNDNVTFYIRGQWWNDDTLKIRCYHIETNGNNNYLESINCVRTK